MGRLAAARAADRTTVIHVETDPSVPSPDSEAWWDVPVAEVAALEPTRKARADYEAGQLAQRPALRPARRR
jgi:3D-(3,5/4)-trihydroxycyclohexane-1,2-dione acylhydrolase (decyclizing)